VRRTAEIFLFDADDYESMFAKYGINGLWGEKAFERHEKIRQLLIENDVPVPAFFDELAVKRYSEYVTDAEGNQTPHNYGRPLHHRRMSNNSVAFTRKPEKEHLDLIFEMLQMEGEPGFVNLEELARRRLKGQGILKPSRKLLEEVMELIGMNPCAKQSDLGSR
jgi:hypothetical protein